MSENTESNQNIPVQGSLGLLALGYIGLMIWREKRIESIKLENRGQENEG